VSESTENRSDAQPSCDPSLSRAEFIKMLVDRAKLAGALVILPAIADAFMAPPVVAQGSGGQTGTALGFKKPIA
jgi:hypothetical protein